VNRASIGFFSAGGGDGGAGFWSFRDRCDEDIFAEEDDDEEEEDSDAAGAGDGGGAGAAATIRDGIRTLTARGPASVASAPGSTPGARLEPQKDEKMSWPSSSIRSDPDRSTRDHRRSGGGRGMAMEWRW
jgi:hypothetical protein